MRICLWGLAIVLTRITVKDWTDAALICSLGLMCIAGDLREMKRSRSAE